VTKCRIVHQPHLRSLNKPAAQGDAKAQLNLGIMYAKGRGVAHDDVQAYTWFDLAAANFTTKPHHDKAVKARDTLATPMTPAQIAEAPKLAREWKKQ
jgi:TPR repeat protein